MVRKGGPRTDYNGIALLQVLGCHFETLLLAVAATSAQETSNLLRVHETYVFSVS